MSPNCGRQNDSRLQTQQPQPHDSSVSDADGSDFDDLSSLDGVIFHAQLAVVSHDLIRSQYVGQLSRTRQAHISAPWQPDRLK